MTPTTKACVSSTCTRPVPWNQGSDYCTECIMGDNPDAWPEYIAKCEESFRPTPYRKGLDTGADDLAPTLEGMLQSHGPELVARALARAVRSHAEQADRLRTPERVLWYMLAPTMERLARNVRYTVRRIRDTEETLERKVG